MTKVYAHTSNHNGVLCVDEITSIPFEGAGWSAIDEGEGERYEQAQSGSYLTDMVPLLDDEGHCNYKLEDSALVLMDEAEKAQAYPSTPPAPSIEERMNNQEQATLALMDTILMMNGGNGNV